MKDISIKYYTGYFSKTSFLLQTMLGEKSIGTLGSKIRFLSVLVTFSPLSSKTMLIFLFLRLHRPQRLHNIELGAGGIGELMLDANKIEQILKYRKASVVKGVLIGSISHFFIWLKKCMGKSGTKVDG